MEAKTTDYTREKLASKFEIAPLVHKFVGRPAFIDFIGKINGLSVLDIGCGPGYITNELRSKGARCTGVDPSAPFIQAARKKYPEIDFLQGQRLKAPISCPGF